MYIIFFTNRSCISQMLRNNIKRFYNFSFSLRLLFRNIQLILKQGRHVRFRPMF